MQQEMGNLKKKKSYTFFILLFLAIIAVAIFICVLIPRLLGNADQQISITSSDDIAITTLQDGDRFIEDKTGNYSFTLPASWYFERKEGSGIAVYPNYIPDVNASPECKIETSVFPSISPLDLNGWITNHLHEDPTVTVLESSRTAVDISGASITIRWMGALNEITTTLIYASTQGNIYEIAPSVLDIKKAEGNIVCNAALDSFLTSIRFLKNAQK